LFKRFGLIRQGSPEYPLLKRSSKIVLQVRQISEHRGEHLLTIRLRLPLPRLLLDYSAGVFLKHSLRTLSEELKACCSYPGERDASVEKP